MYHLQVCEFELIIKSNLLLIYGICVPVDLEADISQLEAPTFTTINRGPPEPMLRLDWSHKVSLIGEKVLNPMIHCCDKCLKPILIYGRMVRIIFTDIWICNSNYKLFQIPCKHVFCLACGKKEQKQCPRCLEKVTRVEQTGLGTVFMCTHGGTRYGQNGCRRTYLSQRDLQAHINHRHVANMPINQQPMEVIEPERSLPLRTKTANDPRSGGGVPSNLRSRPIQAQVSGVRTNLITVPIQESAPTIHETAPTTQNYYQFPQTATYTQSLPPMHIPPPQQPQYYTAPPSYSPAQSYPTYTGTAPTVTQYAPPVQAQNRQTPQYDYNAAQQWGNNQQYYR